MLFYSAETVIIGSLAVFICRNKITRKISEIITVFVSIMLSGVFCILNGDFGMYGAVKIVLTALTALIAVCDIREMCIPSVLLLALNAVGAVSSFFIPEYFCVKALACTWIIAGVCFFAGKKCKNSIGNGDIFCMSGLMMSMSFSQMMSFLFLSLFAALIYGIAQILLKKKTMKSELPFTPFLLMGYLILMLFSV